MMLGETEHPSAENLPIPFTIAAEISRTDLFVKFGRLKKRRIIADIPHYRRRASGLTSQL